jgi:hypothetical protein
MDLSYWELKLVYKCRLYHWSGIVGLHAALRLREKIPDSKILVLEKECCHKERVLKTLVLLVLEVFQNYWWFKIPFRRRGNSTRSKRWKGLQLLRKDSVTIP